MIRVAIMVSLLAGGRSNTLDIVNILIKLGSCNNYQYKHLHTSSFTSLQCFIRPAVPERHNYEKRHVMNFTRSKCSSLHFTTKIPTKTHSIPEFDARVITVREHSSMVESPPAVVVSSVNPAPSSQDV